jgi:hypothetical protein
MSNACITTANNNSWENPILIDELREALHENLILYDNKVFAIKDV